MAESIVTSVPDPSSFSPILPNPTNNGTTSQNHTIHLDLRNQHFAIDREALIELPESILLCLFPNGVVLSQKQQQQQQQPHDVYYVDFDGPCLSYILNFFNQARLSYYGTSTRPVEPLQLYAHIPSPLFYRQAVIVLREELEYFAIPTTTHQSSVPSPSSPTAPNDNNNDNNKDDTNQDKDNHHQTNTTKDLNESNQDKNKKETKDKDKQDITTDELLARFKKNCGDSLLADKSIFTALQRNVERENNVAEKHLIDMLCMSGFDRTDKWGYRTLEPRRCAISSLALVLLKTGITHDSSSSPQQQQPPPPPNTNTNTGEQTDPSSTHSDTATVHMTGPSNIARMTPQVNATQLNTAQKLLLFWRKPARKCWWDATEIQLQLSDDQVRSAKLWARRVWTLELSLI